MVEDFEIKITPHDETIIYPLKKSISMGIMVTNKSNKSMEFILRGRINDAKKRPSLTPQWVLHLEPGESRPVTYLINEEYFLPRTRPRTSLETLKSEVVRTMTVNIIPTNDQSKAQTVALKHVIRIIPKKELENSIVQGYVYDEDGEPMKGITVTLRGKSNVYNPSGKTDDTGFYSIGCYGQYPYQIEAEADGCQWFHRDIEPPWLGPMTVDIHMKKLNVTVNYELIKKHDLNLYHGMGCIGWMSDNQKYVLIGFRAEGERVNNPTDIYFFNIEGELLWKQPMKGCVWALDIADDGSLVSAASIGAGEGHELILFDNQGNALWRRGNIHSRETRISHNKKYVASQGDSVFFQSRHIYLLDANNGDLIWKRDTTGQVRGIRWSKDDSKLYVFSGSGYLNVYDLEGELLWRAYTGSWPEHPVNVDITEDEELIAACGHWGEISLINKEGCILWSRFTNGYIFGQTSIAPDKSYVMVASVGEYGLVKFDMEGNIMWRKGLADCVRVTGDSERMLYSLRDTYLLDRNGSTLWHYPIGNSIKFSEITKDETRIVVANQQGMIYFFQKK